MMTDAQWTALATIAAALIAAIGAYVAKKERAARESVPPSPTPPMRARQPADPSTPDPAPLPSPTVRSDLRSDQASVAPVLQATPPLAPTDTKRSYIREAGPKEIRARLSTIPPLSRDVVAKEVYVDRWVRWSGEVKGLRAYPDEIRMSVRCKEADESLGTWIGVAFPLDARHVLEPVREGETIVFVARIAEFFGGDVMLDSAELLEHHPS